MMCPGWTRSNVPWHCTIFFPVARSAANTADARSKGKSFSAVVMASRLVNIILRLPRNLGAMRVEPLDRLGDAGLERNGVAPTERAARLGTVEQVSGVLARTILRHLCDGV